MTATRRTKRTRTPAQLANDARLGAARREGVQLQPTPPTQAEATAEAVRLIEAGPGPHNPAAGHSVPRDEMRADMRPPQRTSAEEATIRAAQIFENVDLDSEDDKFALPPNLAPDGWEYEWKTQEVMGKRNPGNEVQLARMGWDPVDTTRHPEMMPQGYTGAITREGMMLMQRPKIVNDRQRQAAYTKAVRQVRGQEEQIGTVQKGQFARDSRVMKVESEFVPPSAVRGEGFVGVSHRGAPMPVPE